MKRIASRPNRLLWLAIVPIVERWRHSETGRRAYIDRAYIFNEAEKEGWTVSEWRRCYPGAGLAIVPIVERSRAWKWIASRPNRLLWLA